MKSFTKTFLFLSIACSLLLLIGCNQFQDLLRQEVDITDAKGEGLEGGILPKGVRKGVICHNPSQLNTLLYVYIDANSSNAFHTKSTDGGNTWGTPVQITSLFNVKDLAAVMDGNGNGVGVFIDSATDDTCAGARVVYSVLYNGSNSWAEPSELLSGSPPQLRLLPSVVHTNGNEYLFGVGYDTGGGGSGNDTNALTSLWDGNTMEAPPQNVDLDEETDNPITCQQVAYDLFNNSTIYYLYFDNHSDWEANGGDMFVIPGTYEVGAYSWSGSETRVVDKTDNERPGQGYLFHGNGGDLILIYAVEVGSPPSGNALYMKHADDLGSLDSATETSLETQLQFTQNTWGRYRTVYAAQDPTGDIHIVFQDLSNNIKWIKINSSTYAIEITQTIATEKWIDSISMGENTLYVSMIDDLFTTNNASLLKLFF
ncbi:MAG TPA: hypothetical protein PLG79_11680 [Spirochaetales bacterium]|nr:hypothetical protein [Spirochaetales bacterium]